MKQFMLFAALAFVAAPQLKAQAGSGTVTGSEKTAAEKRAKTPDERARKDADRAEKTLDLNPDQKAKWQAASLQRILANKPLREKMRASADKTEKHDLAMQMRGNAQTFDATVNGFLTDAQKAKWEQVKQEKKEAHKKRMKNRAPQPAPGTPQD